jgi:hypothetical protein
LEIDNVTDDAAGFYLIHIFYQNIVFVDSVLDGLEPPVDAGILNIRNSTVRFVRLTVKSCILSGTLSSTLNLGNYSDHAMWESLSIQDSNFTQNSGNMTLGSDGFLIRQSSGKLLINNTRFIGNAASEGGQVLSSWLGVASSFFSLKIDACTFRNNSGFDAGVQVYSTTRSEVLDCSFENNRVAAGLGSVLRVTTPPWQQHCGSLLVRVYHAEPIPAFLLRGYRVEFQNCSTTCTATLSETVLLFVSPQARGNHPLSPGIGTKQ